LSAMAFCANCGHEISDLAAACPKCEHPTQLGRAAEAYQREQRMLLPVGRTKLAIAAGYVGLFGLGFFPLAPVAIILGVLALVQLRRTPDKVGNGRAIFAIAAGAVSIVGWAVALVLISRSR